MNYSSNIRLLLCDEISLEGLDGITLQTLWIRISQRTNTKLPFPERLEKEYWNAIKTIPDFAIYELPEARADYVPFDRVISVDSDQDFAYMEPTDVPDDIYVHKVVNDTLKGVKGSCPTYFSRKDITENARKMDYESAKLLGNKLVIVASQELRDFALIGNQVSDCIELTPVQHCVLERIGRSRYMGEITQGKRSLQIIREDPKTLFYHRKTLMKYKLITKQTYYQKTGNLTSSGSLIHLRRFFVEKKSKQMILTEQIVDFLKTKPNHRAQYSEIMQIVSVTKPIKKLLKSNEFQKFVITDLKIPYREFFPECHKPEEWRHKKCDKERLLRCVQLIDPEVDVSENWYLSDSEDEDDNASGFKDYGNLKFGLPLLPQAAEVVRSAGENGCCQTELGNIMGVNRLTARSFCRTLQRRNVVNCILSDIGRQRVTKFTSKKYAKGTFTLQLKQEREKMLNLMSSSNIDLNASISNNDPSLDTDENSIQSSVATNPNSNDKSVLLDTSLTSGDTSVQTFDNSIKVGIKIGQDEADVEPAEKRIKLSCETPEKRSLEDFTQPEAKKLKLESSDDPKQNLQDIEVKIIVTESIPGLKGYSVGFLEQMNNESKTNDGSKVTYRILKRANYIIESVREMKVITDLINLKKKIQEDENAEGYNSKLDKKSLVRLILKLAKEGYVKYMKAVLTCSGKSKTIIFICDPSIDNNHSLIQSAIEQTKMKFNLAGYLPPKKAKPLPASAGTKFAIGRRIAKVYGFCPKFIRMRLVHEFLYYLIYDNTDYQSEPLTTPEEYKEWLANLNMPYDDQLISEMTPIYFKKEINWRTFIPPIPKHNDWPIGWALICDILLRMPVHIFVQCFSVMFKVDGLENYLNHPVRRNLLVKHLPNDIRNSLMYKRRYIYQMHEICTRLCYCGLIQFGPQKLKEKDQVFIYLNKKTSMLNTTTSEQGYHEISSKEYDKHFYNFDSSTDVETYWYDLWSTCMNTLLGGRLCLQGKYIVIEDLDTKPAMVKALLPRTQEEAAKRDNGDVPGNRRGAAGLDSALFAHLRRSWNWNFNNEVSCVPNKIAGGAFGTESVFNPNEYIDLFAKIHTVSGPGRHLNKLAKKFSAKSGENQPKRYKMKKSNIVRKITPVKPLKVRKPFYDEIDKIALDKMGKLRADWSPLEDHILLLCTIASKYLCPNRHKQTVAATVIRDVLHKLVKNAASKTSRACQRRILYIMKNKNTQYSVQMCLEELNQSENITKKYKQICKRILNSHVPETEMNIAFIELVSQMSTMFSKLIEPNKKIQIPNTIQKFKENFHICGSFRKNVSNYKEPENTSDISFQVVRTVVHSSMCCSKDKTSWAYQLFKIYQQYPETLLRAVIAKARQEQMIATKKSYMRAHKIRNNMPLSSSPFQLSIIYKYKLHTKFPYIIFDDVDKLLTNFIDWSKKKSENNEGFEIVSPTSGTVIALMELADKIDIKYSFQIPDDIIVLDQSVQNDKYYERIIKKYQNFMNDPNSAEIEEIKSKSEEEKSFPDVQIDGKKPENSPNFKNLSSRIAFYMMRAEMSEGFDEKSTQHMHDYFVVNACRVYINLPHFETQNILEPEQIHEDFALVKNEIVPELLKEIRSNAIIPDLCPSNDEIQIALEESNANDNDKHLAQKIIEEVLESGIFGTTNSQIMNLASEFHDRNLSIQNLLNVLINIKIILRAGVESVRYVHYEHKRYWIVNSYKILRLEREKMPVATASTKEKLSTKLYRKKTNYHSKEIEISRERLDLRSEQKVTVSMSPWIRIDGTLNRRVLDRWVGTILLTCIQEPGITLQRLIQTFSFLRPVELDNLVHYLVKLKCIRQVVVKKSKTTLFSSVPSSTLETATGLEDPNDIFIEPSIDATIKYAIFLGKKSYANDFLVI